MRSGARVGRFLAGVILALGLATAGGVLSAWLPGVAKVAGATDEQPRYRDAAPTGIPEGFEPVDISEEMHQVESQRTQEMYRDVDRGMRARYDTPERRIRARYGGATWNMYDPFH